jgi:hypothetical protein
MLVELLARNCTERAEQASGQALPDPIPNFRGVFWALTIVIIFCAMGLAIDFFLERPPG